MEIRASQGFHTDISNMNGRSGKGLNFQKHENGGDKNWLNIDCNADVLLRLFIFFFCINIYIANVRNCINNLQKVALLLVNQSRRY